jgi:hypothetical protein
MTFTRAELFVSEGAGQHTRRQRDENQRLAPDPAGTLKDYSISWH